MRVLNNVIVLVLLIATSCNTQNNSQVEPQGELIEIESYSSFNSTVLPALLRAKSTESKYDSLIQSVLYEIGLPNTDIKIMTVKKWGAFSVITKNCYHRYFMYNEAFFDSILAVTGSINCIKSVCFHELAHHFYRHPLKGRRYGMHNRELEADRFSGFQMRMISATREEAILTMMHFGDSVPRADAIRSTHPDKHDRVKEIEKGFDDAGTRFFGEGIDTVQGEIEVDSIVHLLNNTMKELILVNPKLYPDPIESDNDKYLLLNNIIQIAENGDVVDMKLQEKVGGVIRKNKDGSSILIDIDGSRYMIINDEIFSGISENSIKIGHKL